MKLKEVESPQLYQLVGYLKAISDVIRTGELKWHFEVKLFEFDEAVSDIRVLVKIAYPGASPDKAEITEGSVTDLVDTFKHEFGRDFGPIQLSNVLTPAFGGGMWHRLNKCIELQGARIYEYTTSDPLDSFGSGGILGNLAVVILNTDQKRCLFLSGGDCD